MTLRSYLSSAIEFTLSLYHVLLVSYQILVLHKAWYFVVFIDLPVVTYDVNLLY